MKQDSKYSWCVLASTFLAICLGVAFPMHGSISINVHTWIHDLGLSPAQVGWVSSVLNLFFLSLGPVYNIFTQTIGFWRAQFVAGCLSALGLICTAFSTQFWQITLSYSILAGMGCSISQLNSFTAIKTYFGKHRTKAFSISYAGNSCGQLLGPIITDFLIQTVSYRNAFFIQAGIVLAVTISAAFFYRGDGSLDTLNDDRAEQPQERAPENMLSNLPVVSLKVELKAIENVGQTPECSTAYNFRTKLKQIAKQQAEMLKNIYFILALFSYFLAGMAPAIFLTYIIEYAEESGYATSSQGTIGQTIFGGAALCAALLTTALMKFNKRPVILHSLIGLCAGVVAVCLPSVNSLAGHYTLCFAIGFCESLMFTNMMSHAQTFSHDHIDLRVAYLLAFFGFGYVVGPIISAFIIQPLGMKSMFYIAGGFSILASLFTIPAAIKNSLNNARQLEIQQH